MLMKKFLLSLMLVMLSCIELWGADGDTFTAYISVNKTPTWGISVKMTFKVISESEKTCQVGDGTNVAIDEYPNTTNLNFPQKVNGYTIVKIGDNAFASGGLYDITNVDLPSTVTSIGKRAFQYSKLAKITIPNSVNSIGEEAFKNCNIKSIDLPSSISEIGGWAFGYCLNLTSVTIPTSIAKLPTSIFFGCSNLSNVVLHNQIVTIGQSAFALCTSLESINIPSSVSTIEDGAFSGCTSLSSFTFPLGITQIQSATFNGCTSLTTINIPNSVTDIGDSAFQGCSNLSSVTLSSNLQSIGRFTFKDCVNLPSITIPTKVEGIGSSAFEGCIKLESISIPGSVTILGGSAFANCSSLSQLALSEGLTDIGYSAFENCSSITSVTIPSTITKWGENAFRGCYSLSNVVLSNGVNCIGNYAFSGCSSITSIFIPSSVTCIGREAFENCSALESVTTSEGLTRIELGAFLNCCNLLSFTFPQSVNYLGGGVFGGCSKITSIEIPNSITKLCGETFANCSKLETVKLSENLTEMRLCDFYSCTSLKTITIPQRVTSIGESVFEKCNNLTSVIVKSETPSSVSSSAFPNQTNATLYVPVGCKSAYEAAECWKNFKEIVEIQNVNVIDFADSSVKKLCVKNWDTDKDEELSVEEAAAVNETFGSIFQNQEYISSFDELRYFTNITQLNAYSFYNCAQLTTITLPNSLLSIGMSAFAECRRLTDINIPKNVQLISSYAFKNCNHLTTVSIPGSVTTVQNNAFYGCNNITTVNVGWNIPLEIPENVFPNRSNATLFVPAGSKNLYMAANYWKDFKEIVEETAISDDIIVFSDSIVKEICVTNWDSNGDGELSESEAAAVTYLGTIFKASAISSFDELRYFKSLISIDVNAFRDCLSLNSIVLPTTIRRIDDNAFKDCINLSTITIPDGVGIIGRYVFDNTAWYNNQPDNQVAYIGKIAYKYKGEMPFSPIISLKEGTKVVAPDAFANCNGMNSLIIPNSVTSICKWAFFYCWNLKTVSVGSGVTYIGPNAFANCGNLTTIKVKKSNPIDITNKYVFNSSIFLQATLYVPLGCKSAYEVAECWKDFATIVEMPDVIEFIDVKVKDICVSNWDTDGDGELSKDEAIAVTSIGTVFQNKTEITSFSEFRYFTGVTLIGQYALSGCTNLSSIEFPSSLKTIDRYALYNSGFESIEFPNGVTSIGNSAIRNCTKLTSVKIGNGTVAFGKNVFRGCTQLSTITFDRTDCQFNGEDAFRDCTSLTSVKVTDIAAWCRSTFTYASSNPLLKTKSILLQTSDNNYSVIKNLVIPDGITMINDNAFNSCDSLESVIIPSTIESVGSYAFANCNHLTSVTARSTTPIAITYYVFSNRSNATLYVPIGCKSAYEVTDYWKDFKKIIERPFLGDIFTDVTEFDVIMTFKVTDVDNKLCQVGDGVHDAVSLTYDDDCITIPSVAKGYTVTSIAARSFYYDDDNKVKELEIPQTVDSIGGSAFSCFKDLRDVYTRDLKAWLNITFVDSSSNPLSHKCRLNLCDDNSIIEIKNLIIPNSITSIKNYAFYGCSSLKSVTIHDKVSNIGQYAFQGCNNLSNVTVMSRNPLSISVSENAFTNRNYKTLHVPYGCKEAYKTANYWKDFGAIVEMPIPGDVNNDGTVDAQDASLVLQYVAKKIDSIQNADVNDDGTIDAQDASLILQYVAKKITW